MPFIPHTPEARVARSDSKDEATTCKGTTSSGRHCRRSLNICKPKHGVLAVIPNANPDVDGAAAFFCWQHKDQAANFVQEDQPSRAAHLYSINRRTSTDTLVERLGLLDTGKQNEYSGKRKKRPRPKAARKEGLPEQWQEIPGPLLAVSTSEKPARKPPQSRRRPHPFLSFLCCGSSDDSDARRTAQVIPRREMTSTVSARHHQHAPLPAQVQQQTKPTVKEQRRRPSPVRPALAAKSPNYATRPLLPRDTSSQTEGLLTWIPKLLSPQTTSQLLAELAKPISVHDEEGYIYMFWLTTTTVSDGSTFLAPSPMPSPRARRTSSSSPGLTLSPQSNTADANASTILLKIGRASNVHRRMNEWTRQCGYNLSLVRFYPYVPSTTQASPSARASSAPPTLPLGPRKVPHAHKVERLIHLELADKRVKRDCETCGKEHREWFEVNGDRQGVKTVDEVIRRWVRWAETAS